MRRISAFTFALLSSTAIFTAPAKADVQLEELKARLERAQKENLILKAEKIEKENLTIKAEALEAENAAMRNESKATKTLASIPQRFEPTTPLHHEQPRPAVKQSQDNESARPREHSATLKAVDKAIAAIPRNDERRELVAVSKAAFDPTPIKQWQGVYVGINAGYGEGQANYTGNVSGPVTAYPGPGAALLYPQIYNSYTTLYSFNGVNNLSGPVAGGQVGYNHQFNNHIVLGFEADLDYVDINNRYAIPGANKISQVSQTGVNNTNYNDRTGINWLGTARVKLGYDLGKFMPYITGGFAYGDVSNNSIGTQQYINSYNSLTLGAGASTTNNSALVTGWAAGAGAEYVVADNWSLKGEYLFTQLGNLNVNGYPAALNTNTNGNPNLVGTSVFNGIIGPWSTHQARVGLNYHTGWLGSSPTVVAKY